MRLGLDGVLSGAFDIMDGSVYSVMVESEVGILLFFDDGPA